MITWIKLMVHCYNDCFHGNWKVHKVISWRQKQFSPFMSRSFYILQYVVLITIGFITEIYCTVNIAVLQQSFLSICPESVLQIWNNDIVNLIITVPMVLMDFLWYRTTRYRTTPQLERIKACEDLHDSVNDFQQMCVIVS